MATLKSLVIDLELRREGFTGSLDQSVKELDALESAALDSGEVMFGFTDNINEAGEAAEASTPNYNKMGQGMRGAGRTALSAAQGFAEGGLAGAIQMSSMNAVEFAAVLSPLAGGIAGLAVGLVPLAMSFLKVEDAAEETNNQLEHTKELADRLQGARSFEVEVVQVSQQLRDATTSEQTGGIIKSLDDRAELIQAERNALERSIGTLEAEAPAQFDFHGNDLSEQRDAYMQEFVDPLRSELADLEMQQRAIDVSLRGAKQQFGDLSLAEEQQKVEDAQSAALVERVSIVGDLLNQLPEAVAPLADHIVEAEQQLHAFDNQIVAENARREAERMEHLQDLANRPAHLTDNMQRGSAEAFRTILQQQQDAPLRRLESVATAQLRELQRIAQQQQRPRNRTRSESDQGEEI